LERERIMRASAILVCAIAAAGCSHDSPPVSSPDAGTLLSCPASDKPLGKSALASTPQVQELTPPGPFQVGQTVPFEVPANTASITIVEQAVSAPDSVVLRTPTQQIALSNTAVPLIVKDPSGKEVYDDNQTLPADVSTLPVFFASDSPATGTLTIPNTTAGLALVGPNGLPAGTWSFIVSDYAYECTSPAASPLRSGDTCAEGTDQSLYEVTVITKPTVGGAIPASGKLDVAIYFATTIAGGPAGAAQLDADLANQRKDPDLERMVATLGQIFAQAGIVIGNVRYALLPADVRATYATGVDIDQSGACGPLSQLLKSAEAGDTLNVFFVSAFHATGQQSGAKVVGIDGTIPGPATIGGTVASGAAVTTQDLRFGTGTADCSGPLNLQCGADTTAYIIAHEAGHYLGLYHVTEADGALFDPLGDTATCLCSLCRAPLSAQCTTSGAHRMSAAECTRGATECGGGENLMFWVLDTQRSLGSLSAQQQSIIRANPLVQIVP
jgi:hypothetical protein